MAPLEVAVAPLLAQPVAASATKPTMARTAVTVPESRPATKIRALKLMERKLSLRLSLIANFSDPDERGMGGGRQRCGPGDAALRCGPGDAAPAMRPGDAAPAEQRLRLRFACA